MNEILSERLVGRKPTREDLEDLAILYRDPLVMKTLSKDGSTLNDEEIRKRLEGQVNHWDQHPFGYSVFHHRDDQRFIGRGGLSNYLLGDSAEVELGYAVVAAEWQQGYATEMARAWLEVGFKQLKLQTIIAFTLPHNFGSRRVMEKVGFQYERDFVHGELPHVLYRVRR